MEEEMFESLVRQANDMRSCATSLHSRFTVVPEDVTPADVESAYRKTLNMLGTIERILQAEHSIRKVDKEPQYGDAYRHIFAAEFVDGRYFRFCFDSPPLLKTGLAVSLFSERFCLDLLEKALEVAPASFRKYDAALIIYVSYFEKSEQNTVPYFDNDNLAIKQILDVIVPIYCVDDASIYCDNLYLSQPGSEEKTELFVVPKENFGLWLRRNQHLNFCKAAFLNADF